MPYSEQFEAIEPSRAEIDSLAGLAVLEFGTPWCGYCQAAAPLIAQALAPHAQIRHLKIEDGKGRALGRSFRVKLWPTLIFLAHGKEQERLVRPTDEASISKALALIAADDRVTAAIRTSEL